MLFNFDDLWLFWDIQIFKQFSHWMRIFLSVDSFQYWKACLVSSCFDKKPILQNQTPWCNPSQPSKRLVSSLKCVLFLFWPEQLSKTTIFLPPFPLFLSHDAHVSWCIQYVGCNIINSVCSNTFMIHMKMHVVLWL